MERVLHVLGGSVEEVRFAMLTAKSTLRFVLLVLPLAACNDPSRPAPSPDPVPTAAFPGEVCEVRLNASGEPEILWCESDHALTDRIDAAPGVDHDACARLIAEARKLVAAHAECTSDSACQAVVADEVFDGPMCMPVFSCAVSLSDTTDVKAFREQALDLDTRFEAECRVCPVPRCADQDYVFSTCNQQINACQVDVDVPPLGPAPGLDEAG